MQEFDTPGWNYFRWFYERGVWKHMTYRGIRTLKLPADMWNYQEIIVAENIEWIVETGTRYGGSALFFTDLLTSHGRKGKVITIDAGPEWEYDPKTVPNLIGLTGDSGIKEDMAVVYQKLLPEGRGPLLLMLDSDHTASHVTRELEAHLPHLRPGDYLIVEDGVVNGHPVRPDHGAGPFEAIKDYIGRNPKKLEFDVERAGKFGCTMAYGGYYKVIG